MGPGLTKIDINVVAPGEPKGRKGMARNAERGKRLFILGEGVQ